MSRQCPDVCEIYVIQNNSEDIVGANVTYQCCCVTKEIAVIPFLPQEKMKVSIPFDAENLSFELLSYNQNLGWSAIGTIAKSQINYHTIEVTGPSCYQQISSPVIPPKYM